MRSGAARPGRLRTAAEYRLVLERGRIASAQNGLLVRVLCNDKGSARLGIIVGRKVMKRAVDRNRVKRMCRATFRQDFARLPAIDIVVQLRAVKTPLDWRKFRRELDARLASLIQTHAV